jgi:GT2 family glycosyltransferase
MTDMQASAAAISVIIASYNTREMTFDCLRTVRTALAGRRSETIVVDNASTDGSAAAIRRDFPDVTLIENADNRGFGAANNQAMRAAAGEFLLLLNSDAFPKPGAIDAMLKCIHEHSDVGVVGPRLLNVDGTLQRSCFRFPSPLRAWLENLWISRFVPSTWAWGDWRRWPHDCERDVDFIIGACMLVRRRVFEATGGFDESFFMYAEEADWQKRIRRAGWRVRFTPAAEVTHRGSGSGDGKMNEPFFNGLDYYELKHHGLLGLLLFRSAMVIGCSLRACGWAMVCLFPRRRNAAWTKLKLRLWLIRRQATHWSAIRRRTAHGKSVASIEAAKGIQ